MKNSEDKPWNNEELKKLVEALPRLKECDLEKESRIYKAKDKSGMRRLPPESPLEFDERNMQRNCGVAGNGSSCFRRMSRVRGPLRSCRRCFADGKL